MVSYGSNILRNSYAVNGSLEYWDVQGVATIRQISTGNYVFQISPRGWMEQTIRPNMLIERPVDVKISVEAWVASAQPIVPGVGGLLRLELKVLYDEGHDIFLTPIMNITRQRQLFERIYPLQDKPLRDIKVRFAAGREPIQLIYPEFRKNLELYLGEEQPDDDQNPTFAGEPILFGPESAMPELR